MKVRTRFFGALAQKVGKEVEVELNDTETSLSEAVEYIFKKLGLGQVNIQEKSASSGFMMVFLNGKAVDPSATVQEGDEISFYPPVSGGQRSHV